MFRVVVLMCLGSLAACASTSRPSSQSIAVAATCPTQIDLTAGIELVRDAPFTQLRLRNIDGQLIEDRVQKRGGKVESIRAVYAHPLAVTERRTSNDVLKFDFEKSVSALADLPTARSFETPLMLHGLAGGPRAGIARWEFVREDAISIGGCQYPVWVVDSIWRIEGIRDLRQRRMFSEALGVTLMAQSLTEDGPPRSEVRFDHIRALP